MSLYNMLFGENAKQKDFLLTILDLIDADLGRYRDVYVTKDHIVIHTRNGGGNREDYQDVFDTLSEHPLYDYDMDDDFDSTYANIYFKHPQGYEEILTEMAKDTITPSEKWEILLNSMTPNKEQQ